jgi:hypothetical protein
MPDQHTRLELDGVFSAENMSSIQRGYIPSNPNDKWFIYFDDGWLHFHRSTTGTAIFALQIVAHGDHFIAPIVIVNRNPEQYRNTDDAYDVTLMAYLIDRYLFGRNIPFPTPSKLHHRHHDTHAKHVIGRDTPKPGNGFVNLNSLLDD